MVVDGDCRLYGLSSAANYAVGLSEVSHGGFNNGHEKYVNPINFKRCITKLTPVWN